MEIFQVIIIGQTQKVYSKKLEVLLNLLVRKEELGVVQKEFLSVQLSHCRYSQ
jgi:hypothetical protein